MVQVKPVNSDAATTVRADKREAAMIDRFVVRHGEDASERSFEVVVAALEIELTSLEDQDIIPREVAAAAGQADFETARNE